MDQNYQTIDQLKQAIISMAVEAWRFRRTFETAMSKLDAGESQKYLSKFGWFQKKVNDALESAGLRIENLEGMEYIDGLPLTPINIDEFEPEERLYIEQMVEPIIMEGDILIKTGTAVLGRIEE